MKALKFMIAAVISASCANGADYTLEYGSEPVTMSENATYDRMLINGDLTIGKGVTVSATSLCLASNINGTATLTLDEGANLTITGTASGDVLLGAAGGTAQVTLNEGAVFSSECTVYSAYEPTVTTSHSHLKMTLNDATFASSGSFFLFEESGTLSDGANAETTVLIRLNGTNSRFTVLRFAKSTQYGVRVEFNGGKICDNGWDGNQNFINVGSYNSSKLTLESIGGNPIEINIAASHSRMLAYSRAASIIATAGAGDLYISGTRNGVEFSAARKSTTASNLRLMHTGALRFGAVKTSVSNSDAITNNEYSIAHDIIVEDGATLDVNNTGIRAKQVTVRGNGSLVNSGSGVSEIRLGVANDDSVWSRSVPSNIRIVKEGTGKLSMFASDVSQNVVVTGGELALKSRREIGYPYYKFNVYSNAYAGVKNSRVKIGEFQYLNGSEDVTQGWEELYYSPTGTSFYSSPTNMLNGIEDSFFYDQRVQNFAYITNIHFELEYIPAKKVTNYQWKRPPTSKLNGTYDELPTAWAVFGSEDKANWRLLSHVEGFEPGWDNGWHNFACTNWPTAVATLANVQVGENARLTVDGAEVVLSAATLDATAPLSLANGAKVTLPDGASVAKLAIDRTAGGGTLVNFTPAASGALYLTDAGETALGNLPVKLQNSSAANLANWSVYLNNTLVSGLHPVVRADGTIGVRAGFKFVIR